MEPPFLKKYRPRLYKDFIIGQEYVELLETLIAMDNLNILLIGDSGCGKTSLLEATVREYYGFDTIPRDNVLYINNLQEQGISYYRTEVKTFCQTCSSVPGKKKFIILDDIDIINDQSQQVFRNCIDKYSHNVHFLASCSNMQKVIESLQSRCTIVKIHSVSQELLRKLLHKIIKREGISINKDAREFILNICNSSIRLLVNYLEKFKLLGKNVTLHRAKDICTNISFFDLEEYTKAWFIERDIVRASRLILTILAKGYSVMDVLDSYFQFVKVTSILDEGSKYKAVRSICKYIATFHTLHEDEVELILLTNDLLKCVTNNASSQKKI